MGFQAYRSYEVGIFFMDSLPGGQLVSEPRNAITFNELYRSMMTEHLLDFEKASSIPVNLFVS